MVATENRIDWSKPVQVQRGDFSPAEFELFRDTFGYELYPFLKALMDGDFSEEELMSSEHLPALCGVIWLVYRRQNPTLTFDEVYQRGIGEIVQSLQSMGIEPEQSAPSRRSTTPKRTPKRVPAATE